MEINFTIKTKKDIKERNRVFLFSSMCNLEDISEILEFIPTKLDDNEKLRFINETLPKVNNYLKEQIERLKKIEG